MSVLPPNGAFAKDNVGPGGAAGAAAIDTLSANYAAFDNGIKSDAGEDLAADLAADATVFDDVNFDEKMQAQDLDSFQR